MAVVNKEILGLVKKVIINVIAAIGKMYTGKSI